MNDRLREEVVRESPPVVLRRLAIEGGMVPMIEDARRKVAEGITTPHEIARVLRDDQGSASPCHECGEPVPLEAVGCPICGVSRSRVCRCARRLRSEWHFCPWCLRRAPG
jgi:hypothetical protein